jgi:membrane protease subunit HflK
MASGGEKPSTEERVRRSVRRTLSNLFLAFAVLGLLGLWASLGAFTLKPGEAAVLLRFGKHVGTIMEDGFHIVPPPPLYERVIVNFSGLRNQDFGARDREGEEAEREDLLEATMQTSGNNIVHLSFAVQYTIKDPFLERFRLADPEAVVRDAAQAAMRQVVGGMTVDGVLREQRALVASEVTRLLQEVLDSYEAGLDVRGVQLLAVEPPGPVRAAFDDVVSATQDGTRLVNEAEGYRNEVLPKAQAEAVELRAAATAYRDATVAEASGRAQRFAAIAHEWRKAPAVTEKRLYLETMESILPDVEKVIIEPGTTQVLPYLPLERRNGGPGR